MIEPTQTRGLVAAALLAPFAWLAIERHVHRLWPDPADGEPGRGRDYYLGYVMGREALSRAEDVEDLVRMLRHEGLPFQVARDDGGEKVFVARALPPTRGGPHDLEAGVLAGGLLRAARARFEVEEERCAARGDGYCRFVAIRG